MDESSTAKFLETVSEACGHPVTLDMAIQELSLDSLDFISLVQSIGVKFDQASKCKTLGELYAHVPA